VLLCVFIIDYMTLKICPVNCSLSNPMKRNLQSVHSPATPFICLNLGNEKRAV
jgi:hypothetical protein